MVVGLGACAPVPGTVEPPYIGPTKTAEAAALQTIEAALRQEVRAASPGAPTVTPDPTATAAAEATRIYATAVAIANATLTAEVAQAPAVTPTPTPTTISPPVATPTRGKIIPAVQVTTRAGSTGLAICLKRADGHPRVDVYVEAFSQIEDVSGNPTYGERVASGYTDQTGCTIFRLNPDVYVVRMNSFTGYLWGNMENFPGMSGLEVKNGQLTVLTIASGRLVVGFAYADGWPVQDEYVGVYTQQSDLDGNPVVGSRVDSGYTDNRGMAVFELMPGTYIVSADFEGYNWGTARGIRGEANVIVSASETTNIQRWLGRLVIEARDSSGKAAEGVYVELYTQTADVAGKPALANRIDSGYTDNSGRIGWDLTHGTYAIQMRERIQYNIPIEWGRTTYVDGTKVLRVE